MKVDIIIVGFGLAGTLLANELIKKGKSILVFNDPDLPKASNVAAGIVNPVVFKRMTKSWMVDEAFPVMEETYKQLEALLKGQLYFPSNIYRILIREEEIKFWNEKRISNNLKEYIHIAPDYLKDNQTINTPHGVGIIKKAGRLDIPELIRCFSNYLNSRNQIQNEKFDVEQLKLNSDGIVYKGITAEKIIFCEGSAAPQNPFFRKVIFKSSKGEVGDIQIPGIDLREIISSEVFILPIGFDRYKIGATYTWDNLNQHITETALNELTGKLKKIISTEFKIDRQQAGIRPTMHDRKPLLGFLPDYPQIGIFNGLGSKGVLLGPFFAKQLAESILDTESEINPEVHIKRYYPEDFNY